MADIVILSSHGDWGAVYDHSLTARSSPPVYTREQFVAMMIKLAQDRMVPLATLGPSVPINRSGINLQFSVNLRGEKVRDSITLVDTPDGWLVDDSTFPNWVVHIPVPGRPTPAMQLRDAMLASGVTRLYDAERHYQLTPATLDRAEQHPDWAQWETASQIPQYHW